MGRREIIDFLVKELAEVSPHSFDKKFVSELIVASVPSYIRVNTLRISPKKIEKKLKERGILLELVNKLGFVYRVVRGEGIGFLPEHLAGYFYIQDLASILTVLALDPKENELVLDACAAPGGKSTLISQLQKNKGIVVANEVDKKRAIALKSNIERMGSSNILITLHDMTKIPSEKWKEKFDKILIDAPCTGDGLLPKKEEKLSSLTTNSVGEMKRLQEKILSTGFQLLRQGGELIYSTCSFTIEENELVLKKFLETNNNSFLKRFNVPIPPEKAFMIDDSKLSIEISNYAGRYFPKKHQTIGFFIAKIGKESYSK